MARVGAGRSLVIGEALLLAVLSPIAVLITCLKLIHTLVKWKCCLSRQNNCQKGSQVTGTMALTVNVFWHI